MAAIGRNHPCPCGSGKKYKHCCALKEQKTSWINRLLLALIVLMLLTGAVVILMSLGDSEQTGQCPPGQVWSPEHGHCH